MMKSLLEMKLEFPALTEKEQRSIKGGGYDLPDVTVYTTYPYWGGGGGNYGTGADYSYANIDGGRGSDCSDDGYTWNDNPDNSAGPDVTVVSSAKGQVWVTYGADYYGGSSYNNLPTGYYEEENIDTTYEHLICMNSKTNLDGTLKYGDHKTALFKITNDADSSVVYGGYSSNINIDVDGAPNAYAPGNTNALDKLANIDEANDLSHNSDGSLYIQGAKDPDPGYYVSHTSYIMDTSLPNTNPAKYLDSTKVAYVALSSKDLAAMQYTDSHGNIRSAQLGDSVLLVNSQTGKEVYAIIGDIGNNNEFGEMSLYAAQQLGFTDASAASVSSKDLVNMFIFPGSGTGQSGYIDQTMIDERGAQLENNHPEISFSAPPAGVKTNCND